MVLECEHKLYQIPIRINFDVLEVLGQLIGATICMSDRQLHWKFLTTKPWLLNTAHVRGVSVSFLTRGATITYMGCQRWEGGDSWWENFLEYNKGQLHLGKTNIYRYIFAL